jgi:hypothetical protein
MTSRETPFERLGRQLEAAGERQVARKRRWRWPLGLFGAVVVFGVGAGAWAATSLLSRGAPVPYTFGAPVAGVANGAPLPGTVKLLADDIPDPGGGPPWGLRYWETDRKYACLQIGRIYQGKLGLITGGKTFHELRVGAVGSALGGCYMQDGSGHAYAAVYAAATRGGQPGLNAHDRTLDFGLLGPNAKSYVYRAGGRDHTATPLGEAGAYLVVQKHLPPTIRVVGFHHKDPKLDVRAPVDPSLTLTPASKVIRRVDYTSGTCTVRRTQAIFGACNRYAGYVPIPQPAVNDVRAPVHLRLLKDGRTFRVRFRARQTVADGRSVYNLDIRRKGGPAYLGISYEHDVAAGELVKTTVRAHKNWHGTYVVTAQFRTVPARPGPHASPASPGLTVGRAEITFR